MLIRKKRGRKHNEGSRFIPLNHPPYLPLRQSARSQLGLEEVAREEEANVHNLYISKDS